MPDEPIRGSRLGRELHRQGLAASPEFSEPLHAAIMQRVAAAGPGGRPGKHAWLAVPPAARLGWRRPLAVAAAAAVLLGVSGWLWLLGGQHGAAGPAAGETAALHAPQDDDPPAADALAAIEPAGAAPLPEAEVARELEYVSRDTERLLESLLRTLPTELAGLEPAIGEE